MFFALVFIGGFLVAVSFWLRLCRTVDTPKLFLRCLDPGTVRLPFTPPPFFRLWDSVNGDTEAGLVFDMTLLGREVLRLCLGGWLELDHGSLLAFPCF
ncbi:hypothetical protein F4861DRAFT_520738 [Xylaria intraflava]|nr:hypothetical protein F4861DRAFT_520738 [Xylaria intraflava]